MGWKPKKSFHFFSPKEIVAQQLGPSSFRYVAKKSAEDYLNEPATPRDNPYTPIERVYGKSVPIDKVYVPEKKKKTYYWEASRWSSFNYDNWNYSYSAKADLIIKSPENYLTPNPDEIKAKVNVYDTEYINIVQEMARICYFKMIGEKDIYTDEFITRKKDGGLTKLEITRMEYYNSMLEEYLPGYNPLEQAVHCYFQYRDKTAEQKHDVEGNPNCRANFERDVYSDVAIANQLTLSEFNIRNKIEILSKISLVGKLGGEFEVEKETGETEVSNSPYYKSKPMREYEQLSRIEAYQRLHPLFKQRFATKNLSINVPLSKSVKKQIIIILLDMSGSMSDHEKQVWVNSILIDRFKYVIKGEAEIYFSGFIYRPDELRFIHIKDEDDVKSFWKSFSNRPRGGTTDIGRIVEYVADEVKAKRLHNLKDDLSVQRPEILIINDGRIGLVIQ